VDTVDKILFATGLAFVVYGIGGFVATWILPSLQKHFFYRPSMHTGTLSPTSANRVLMSSYFIAIGAYIVASSADQHALSWLFLACTLVCAVKISSARKNA